MESSYFKEKISVKFLAVVVFLLALLIGITIYQNSVIDTWRERYSNATEALNETREDLLQLQREYSNLQEDVRRYDQIYGQQRTKLEYSKEIALIEVFHNYARQECVPEIRLNVSKFPALNITAESTGGETPLHIFMDGGHVKTFEIKPNNVSTYTTNLETFSTRHSVDIVNYNFESSEPSSIKIHNITLGSHSLSQESLYYDTGSGPSGFDCQNALSGKDSFTNGSIRFSILR